MIGYNQGWGKFQNDHFEKLSLWKISKWSFLIVVVLENLKRSFLIVAVMMEKNSFSFQNGKRYFSVFRCYNFSNSGVKQTIL